MSALAGEATTRGVDGQAGGVRIAPQLYFVGSAVFHYLGPSFAVLLFARVPVGGVAWMRIVAAAVAFAVWRRPWRAFRRADRPSRQTIVALGAVFAAMNYCFYIAIDRLPLGTVAAIEFVGPVLLALAGVRRPRNLAALVCAVGGVYLLADVRLAGEPAGFAWAFANAGLFTLYIVLAHRSAGLAGAGAADGPIDRLGAAMLIAAVVITPLGAHQALPALSDPVAVGAGIAVGLTSSVIPYVFDQLAMARMRRSTYALFVALLPATAVTIGIIVLHQVPAVLEVVGVGLVVLGVLIHVEPCSETSAGSFAFRRFLPRFHAAAEAHLTAARGRRGSTR
jgi:inner membrane transporter RhtA